jgi:hypothetical protein
VRYEVEDGSKVRFWHDVWHGEQPLKFSFLELFFIAYVKDAWVANYIQFRIGNIYRNTIFARPVHD